MEKIKIVILCGGLGTRLREETEFRPKPMIDVGGYPILWHIMKIYAQYGFKNFILCLGYKGEMVKEYFCNYEMLSNDSIAELGNNKDIQIYSNHQEKDWRVTLVDTGKDALKGSRIKQIEKYIDTDLFMLTYGDGVANVNLREVLFFHKKHKKVGTVSGVRPPSRFGELVIKEGKVNSFVEKPQVSRGSINGGFFVFNKKIFDYLSDAQDCDFEKGPLEKLALEGELMAYEHKGEWECMDTLRDVVYLNGLWNSNKAFWKIWKD